MFKLYNNSRNHKKVWSVSDTCVHFPCEYSVSSLWHRDYLIIKSFLACEKGLFMQPKDKPNFSREWTWNEIKPQSKGSESNHVTHNKQSVDEAFLNVWVSQWRVETRFPQPKRKQRPTDTHTHTHNLHWDNTLSFTLHKSLLSVN